MALELQHVVKLVCTSATRHGGSFGAHVCFALGLKIGNDSKWEVVWAKPMAGGMCQNLCTVHQIPANKNDQTAHRLVLSTDPKSIPLAHSRFDGPHGRFSQYPEMKETGR